MKPLIYAIDDCSATLGMYVAALRDLYEVKTFRGCSEKVIEQFVKDQPVLVICDLLIPPQSGWDIADKLLEQIPYTPILIATGVKGDEQQALAEIYRFGYWQKSSNIKELREIICQMIATSNPSLSKA
ncbi:MAG: response regulator [Desulfuromonadales bacterium]